MEQPSGMHAFELSLPDAEIVTPYAEAARRNVLPALRMNFLYTGVLSAYADRISIRNRSIACRLK